MRLFDANEYHCDVLVSYRSVIATFNFFIWFYDAYSGKNVTGNKFRSDRDKE